MAKAKEEPKLEGEPIIEVYRVLHPVVLVTDRQTYFPGDIVDLSHLPDKSIQHFLKKGIYELADEKVDGPPKNVPQPTTEGRKKRPCCK
jgi:hypothetical protein